MLILVEIPRYIIEHMTVFHCKRGPSNCEHCTELKAEGPKWCVLELFSGGTDEFPVARPITEIKVNGEKLFAEFEFKRCFDSIQGAEKFLESIV